MEFANPVEKPLSGQKNAWKVGEVGMTLEEFISKSDDWHEGYLWYVLGYEITGDKPKEFWLGLDYAIRHAEQEKQKGEFPFVFFGKKGR